MKIEGPFRNRQVVGSTPTLGSRIPVTSLRSIDQSVDALSVCVFRGRESIRVQNFRYAIDCPPLRFGDRMRVDVKCVLRSECPRIA